jgi:hypothetical protein
VACSTTPVGAAVRARPRRPRRAGPQASTLARLLRHRGPGRRGRERRSPRDPDSHERGPERRFMTKHACTVCARPSDEPRCPEHRLAALAGTPAARGRGQRPCGGPRPGRAPLPCPRNCPDQPCAGLRHKSRRTRPPDPHALPRVDPPPPSAHQGGLVITTTRRARPRTGRRGDHLRPRAVDADDDERGARLRLN